MARGRRVVSDEELIRSIRELEKTGGVVREAATNLGINESTLRDRIKQAKKRLDLAPARTAAGVLAPIKAVKAKLPPKGEVKRYILTSAQNNTHINVGAWANLCALAEFFNAEVLVGTYTYDLGSYGKKSIKRGAADMQEQADAKEDLWYAPEIEPYINDQRIQLAPGLVWCGEQNILPTAGDPLSGLELYAGRNSIIIPQAKFAAKSVASGKLEGTKFNYTTGTVTLRNYIQKRTGLSAEVWHGYGGLIVEVCDNGDWFVRQLQVAEDDSVQDLDLWVQGGEVTDFSDLGDEGPMNFVEDICHGDIHSAQIDPVARDLTWGKGGMVDVLRPRMQHCHDLLDFTSRNPHERGNPHKMFKKHVERTESVDQEIADVVRLVNDMIVRPWCETYVVYSNHDDMLERWLRDSDYRFDPVNARCFLELQLAKYKAIEARDDRFHTFEHACRLKGIRPDVVFLREDESHVICKDVKDGGIEAGMHGHLGPGGSRGSARSLAKYGRAANGAHNHGFEIRNDYWQAGTLSKLDMGFNRGPGNWSHSSIVTYPMGTRTILTMWGGRWRAPR